jgi:hypothetical protein
LILKHRGDFDYFLISRTDNSESLLASLNPDEEVFEQKLSKQNCDEIFGVVDVEKLVEERFGKSLHHANSRACFREGFNKAIELNKDKVFNEKSILGFGQYVWKYGGGERSMRQLLNDFKHPERTEISVEIVMEECQNPHCENGTSSENGNDPILCKSCGGLGKSEIPKLDSNGCLILKKI